MRLNIPEPLTFFFLLFSASARAFARPPAGAAGAVPGARGASDAPPGIAAADRSRLAFSGTFLSTPAPPVPRIADSKPPLSEEGVGKGGADPPPGIGGGGGGPPMFGIGGGGGPLEDGKGGGGGGLELDGGGGIGRAFDGGSGGGPLLRFGGGGGMYDEVGVFGGKAGGGPASLLGGGGGTGPLDGGAGGAEDFRSPVNGGGTLKPGLELSSSTLGGRGGGGGPGFVRFDEARCLPDGCMSRPARTANFPASANGGGTLNDG